MDPQQQPQPPTQDQPQPPMPAPAPLYPSAPPAAPQAQYPMPPPGVGYPGQQAKTNIFAILSLVFSLLFFIPFASVLGLIFGIVGMTQIKHNGEQGKGLAIAGIIISGILIALGILYVIFAIILAASGNIDSSSSY